MAYRIAVIDDNTIDTEYIATLAKSWGRMREYALKVETFPSAEAFLFCFSEDRVWDILLCDIEMKAINGVELAKRLRCDGGEMQIVFITGFPDYVAEGYEVSALHYLMKPVKKEKLYEVLDRAAKNIEKAEKRLAVTFDRQTTYIPLSKITYIEAQKQYVLICTQNGEYRMKMSLSEIEKQLDEYFYKCQRSFVVNLQHVHQIKSTCVVLKNGEEVPISRGSAEKIGKEIIRLF